MIHLSFFRKLFLSLTLSAFGMLLIACGSSRSFEQELKKELTETENLNSWFRGIMIYDPVSKEVLLEHNAHKYFIPASNTKLLTLYTGIKLLKDSVPALKYATRNDSLFFKGTGDPSLFYRDFDATNVLLFLKSRPETLVLISPGKKEKAFGPGWAWEDYNYAFSAERSEFPLFGNLVTFRKPANSAEIEVIPSFFRSKTSIDSSSTSGRVSRMQTENSFKIPIFDTSAIEQRVPFITSPQLSAQLLSESLGRDVISLKKIPENLSLEKKIYNSPARSLYKIMLQESDNFVAEQLLLLAAGTIADTLQAQIAIAHMQEMYLQKLPDTVKWVDGSGLSRYNLMTPRSLVKLLELISQELPQKELLALFPAGGVAGTLKNDYHAPPNKPAYIYAKTGTLNNNHSLSGYLITAKGKTLIFSFMNNNFLTSTAMIKAEMEKILRQYYIHY
ncbi:D-alanyl-D-alanine carboxypeptidase/D-alanyl-D-alanine-endopeptidase [Salinimicrobium oceani]|uniref:D-alanyl-D-alanine carboxypeptidase n=1 Tax=Salinimicrobium oceani TaxID=2722702 RepID=A0ABX1D1F4_9FLAO|nr:D-alanyl-D-alanine carboxypeptidase [Salinimicrobium oceani]NJW54195.1 D-alanyl-D-alanine carboxypeptidase [Salinimicrobium oceani]